MERAAGMTEEQTDFGFTTIPLDEKVRRVGAVFDSVSERYDLMNDLMSFGVHRLWKRFVVATCRLRAGQRVLDLAGGTGDLSILFAREVGPGGQVVLADINASMLDAGRRRVLDEGLVRGTGFVQANAEILPFRESCFDCVCIAFGLRNVTDKARALRSMYEVLRPGGSVVILEFSTLTVPALRALYDAYSFTVLPRLGKLIADDEASYRYLAESIRVHPDQESLLGMLREAGFERCSYRNLSSGIVAIHQGYKF